MPGYRVITADTVSSSSSSERLSLDQNVTEKVLLETDDEIIARLRDRFAILEDMTRAVKRGAVRAMIVSGPPGVGKSFGIEAVLNKHEVFANLADNEKFKKFEIVKGSMSPVCLFRKLYEFSDEKNIVVFDDCDDILLDETSLNLLKGALDSSKKRFISWNKESRSLKDDGIPNTFEFKGGAIFVTNIKFDQIRSKKLRSHLDALESRCHYLDLTIDTKREKLLRIRQIIEDGMLDSYGFDEAEHNEIVDFVNEHQQRLRELSLRMVLKIADLKVSMPSSWQRVAQMSCMR